MATDFTQESVLRFLLNGGGSVRNAELLAHFQRFLRDDEERAQNRELFKRFVNSVATVRQEDGVSYVVLRKKYQTHLGDVATRNETKTKNEKKYEVKAGRGKQKSPNRSRSRDRGEVNNPKTHKKDTRVPPVGLHDATHILPAAGIVNNNDLLTINLEKVGKSASLHTTESSGTNQEKKSDTCPPKPALRLPSDSQRSSGSGQSFEQPFELKAGQSLGLQNNGVYNVHVRQLPSREADGCSRNSFCPPQDDGLHQEVNLGPAMPKEVCLSANTADTHTLCSYDESADWPFPILLSQSQNSASSPCLVDVSTNAADVLGNSHPYSQGLLSRSSDCVLRPSHSSQTNFYVSEPDDYETTAVAPVTSTERRSLPSQALHLPIAATSSLSSSHNCLPIASSSESEWPQIAFLRDEWSSDDALNYRNEEHVRASVHHSHEAQLLSQLHRSERQVTPWHHSTGHLLDEEQRPSLPGSAPGDGSNHGPVARRLSHRLRSRMCRSLGSDLDRAFCEDRDSGEMARLRRLHRISSFLSVHCPMSVSSSRTHSTMDGLSPANSMHSIGQDPVPCVQVQRQSQVPLDALEHEWFVKAAAGTWSDIFSLFREDPSLLGKRDFVSGYTVLHWIAKHGDHRVMNTLSYGVEKTGMAIDVNARSTCGYTPLHVAAIHGHKNLLRLLVHKYKADVTLRDNSGKKAWQYLEKNDRDLLENLGAPRRALGGSVGVQALDEKPPVPPAITSAATVKRHSSLAALFKHKSHLRVSANPETFL